MKISLCTRLLQYSSKITEKFDHPVQALSMYRAVNTFLLGYKIQSFYTVWGTSRCLFSDKNKTHKYSVGRVYSC